MNKVPYQKSVPGHNPANDEQTSLSRYLNYALWLLGRRNYHSAEVKEKLKKKGATQEQIGKVLEKLFRFNYVNDAHYITSYLHYELTRKPQGLYLLKQKLIQKRIPIVEIENALENFPYDEEEQITRALRKKKTNLPNIQKAPILKPTLKVTVASAHQRAEEEPDQEQQAHLPLRASADKARQKEKLFRFLQARGFSLERILKVLE